MDRKEFIKNTCTVCVGCLLLGFNNTDDAKEKRSKPIKLTPVNGKLEILNQLFIDNNTNALVLRYDQLDADILLVKKEEMYTALYMLCTHEGVSLSYKKEKLYCSAHGSQFDMDGNATIEPAQKPLAQFITSVGTDLEKNKIIYIHLNNKILKNN
jgi:Rieske Fe-S protein